MKLCACNNCGNLYEDMNPQSGAKEYPDVIAVGVLKWMPDMDNVPIDEPIKDDIQWYYGCPQCCTDATLTDDIENHVAGRNKLLLQEALIECIGKEEYQEEHTTGWDRLQNLIKLIDDDKDRGSTVVSE